MAKSVLAGRSVVVAGPLGSGKSYFLRAVGADLSALGARHAMVQGSTALAGIEHGALKAAGLGHLVDDVGEPDGVTHPALIVVDDAHDLDEASALVLARLVYSGRVTLVAGLTMPRSSAVPLPPAAPVFLELWMRGEADRIDLQLLEEESALALIDRFDAEHLLGIVTRRALVMLASGSRTLLRELTTESVAAKRTGVDPLHRIRELPPWSRVEAAVSAEIGQYTPDECLAIAVIDALSGIGYADARQILRPSALASLIEQGLVHEDGTTERRLHVSPLIGRAATRRLPDGELESALAAAAKATVEDWHPRRSARESMNIVSHWQSGRDHRPEPDEIDDALAQRLIVSAARDADRLGRYDLALAFVRLGDGRLSPSTSAILRSRAMVGAREERSAVDALLELDPTDLPAPERRRLVRWAVALRNRAPTEDPRLGAYVDRVLASVADDATVCAELAIADAELLALDMDWVGAVERAGSVLATPGISTITRLRATLLLALGCAYTGDWERGEALFRSIELGARDVVTGRTNDVTTASWCLCFEALGRLAVGADMRPIADRLPGVIDAAVLEDNRAALCVLSMAAGSMNWQSGAFPEAIADYSAAVLRCDLLELAIWRPVARYSHAIALESAGRHEEAMRVYERAGLDDRPHRIHDYARELAESVLLPAEGDVEGAAAAAERLLETSSRGTPTLESRDLFTLARLTEPDAEKAERMLALLDAADVPLTRALAEEVTARALGDEELSGQSRRHIGEVGAGWSEYVSGFSPLDGRRSGGDGERTPLRAVGATGAASAAGAAGRGVAAQAEGRAFGGTGTLADLTEREVEIAELVARGLSNKQIAAELYLSVRTVESHIYQARLKLGAGTRRDLGRMVSGESA